MRKIFVVYTFLIILLLVSIGLSGCYSTSSKTSQPGDDKLMVVATTTFIGDVVSRIAGDEVGLTVLLSSGQNPHSFQPTPRDMIKVSDADLIFSNGLGLEEFLDELVDGTNTSAAVIEVSEGITPIKAEGHDHDENGRDPHVWFSPINVMLWTENITQTLVLEDPSRAEFYQTNADLYKEELRGLDEWIRKMVEEIPPESRNLVTDHNTFGYFAEEYGFILTGAMIPAMTTEAETSGQQVAELVDLIRAKEVKAVFIGIENDPAFFQLVADEAGVKLVQLYFGSLSEGDPAGTYLDFMAFNVTAIIEAFR